MIYEIRIRGRKEPIIVEKNAERLKSEWEQYQETKQDKVVEIEHWTGKLSMVLDFQKVGKSESETESTAHQEYLDQRKNILSMPLEERAAKLNWFRLVYFSFTGKRSEEVKLANGTPIEDLAKNIQLKFFTENPKRTICDILAFKPLIKSTKINKIVMPTLDQVMRQDRFAEKHL